MQLGTPHGGSGLPNLTTRARALGGTLSTTLTEEWWFRLRVDLPLAGAARREAA